ncbi:hypothetical protein [Aquisphaera insulae]|uniref:hypothetical protein n=1 Tax=Aquisphaera insulae TaxID=2712864 RepID=UPI0013EDD993|nr:hypothetical protein [Aquisphaera insulae]
MIVVATDYDGVTNSLARVGAQFVTDAGNVRASWPTLWLHPRPASNLPDGKEILNGLQGNPGVALILLGHGHQPGHPQEGYEGQDRQQAVGPAAILALQNRLVVALCCHSLTVMAKASSSHGATILGFRRKFYPHCSWDPNIERSINACIHAGLDVLLRGKTVKEARDETRRAFTLLARHLSRSKVIQQQVFSGFMSHNARGHDFLGVGSSTL